MRHFASSRPRRRLLALMAIFATACVHRTDSPPGERVVAEVRALPAPRASRPPEMPLPPDELARLLESAPFELREMQRAEAGIMGVSKAKAYFPSRRLELTVKWAPAPPQTLDAWNASPRKELAAFAVQRWFLDPDDWVVPPTTMRCVPLATYRRLAPDATATVDGTRCTLGLVAVWLQHVKPADVILDLERFERDRTYAGHLADFNLFTHLVEHRDGRGGNILVSEDHERTYAVDNGIAFGNLVWNYFVTNWDVLRVPGLRRAAVERLRRVTPRDVDALMVVAELRADRKGVLRPVRPTAPIDPSQGVRVRGGQVQLGLTADEAHAVGERVKALLARVDAGEIPLF
jgi:hypothetical protein